MTRPALLLLALAAPVPPHREPPPFVPLPGRYTFRWGSVEYPATLHAGGRYESHYGGAPWSGAWHWRQRDRTLCLAERCDGGTAFEMCWHAALDARGAGVARWETGEVSFSATPARGR